MSDSKIGGEPAIISLIEQKRRSEEEARGKKVRRKEGLRSRS